MYLYKYKNNEAVLDSIAAQPLKLTPAADFKDEPNLSFYMKNRFYYCDNYWSINFFQQEGVFFSQKFCNFFANQFEEIFVRETGIKPSSKVGITVPNRDDSPKLYEHGFISKLNPVLWIMPDYYDDINFCWKSKTGKIIKPTDEDFDEEDLECWIEGLKPNEYWKQVATEKKDRPFKIGKIPFQLKVFGFGTDTILRIYLKDKIEFDLIKAKIIENIKEYNEISEKKFRNKGVVHNVKFDSEERVLTVVIDTGSSGIEIIKTTLKALTKFTSIKKVEVDI